MGFSDSQLRPDTADSLDEVGFQLPPPARRSRIDSKVLQLEGRLEDLLQRKSLRQKETHGGSLVDATQESDKGSRKSFRFVSEYKEYEDEVKVHIVDCRVKRIVSPQGELLLQTIREASRKIEVMAMLPEIMARLVTSPNDLELEAAIGPLGMKAILRLLQIQVNWIECRSYGEKPFIFFGSTFAAIKKRLQKGALYPLARRISKVSSNTQLRQSRTDFDDEWETEDEEEEMLDHGIPPPPTPVSSYIASTIFTASQSSVEVTMSQIGEGCEDWGTVSGVPRENVMGSRLQAAYREVFRHLTTSDVAMDYLIANVKPEVTVAVKLFYGRLQQLEGLMYVKLLVTPEEEIQQLQKLKLIWIKEQRLLRVLKTLESEFEEMGTSKEATMRMLNTNIGSLVQQIDSIQDSTRYEVNKISGEANKQDLVNTKKFDQDIQQLDGTYQAALKFAIKLRTKYKEIEDGWKELRSHSENQLEDVIRVYDQELMLRQTKLDGLEGKIESKKGEVNEMEQTLGKVEMRYGAMVDETRLKKLGKKGKKKKDKGKKGKKGKKKGGSKKKKGDKGKSKKGKSKKRKKDETKMDSGSEIPGEFEIKKKKKKKKKIVLTKALVRKLLEMSNVEVPKEDEKELERLKLEKKREKEQLKLEKAAEKEKRKQEKKKRKKSKKKKGKKGKKSKSKSPASASVKGEQGTEDEYDTAETGEA